MLKFILPLVLFFIFANPETFKLMRGILGGWVASPEGLPKQAGVLLHALVFVIVSKFLWRTFVKRSAYESDYTESDYNESDYKESDYKESDYKESDYKESDYKESDYVPTLEAGGF